ncbi:MAG: hypothetical protein IIT58_10675 [Treponema sp.]|nr:hypothetical protein [Treponema sp.]
MNFNWKPQKLPLQMINGNSRAASEAMAGYIPAEADPNNPYYTQGIPSENAAALMHGYTEEQPAPYVGRTPENMNNAGQGEGYQFNDPEYDAYMKQQEQAEQEATAKQQKIDDIKSQIQTLETRIAENTKKLQGWGGVANKVAALEARKINSQDPTMVWRWKAQMDENRRIADKANGTDNTAKTNASYEIMNDLDSIIVDDKMDSATQKTYLSKLANLKTLAQKNGLPTNSIDAKIREVKGETQTGERKAAPEGSEYEGTSREQWDNEAEELLGKSNLTQGDIMKFKQKNPNISNEVRKKLENKHSELIERDKQITYENKWKNYLADYEKEHGKVSDAFAKTLRRIYDNKNKKG